MTGPYFNEGDYVYIEIDDEKVQGVIKILAGNFARVETRDFRDLGRRIIHHVRVSSLEKIKAY
jgi:hypothetical protein